VPVLDGAKMGVAELVADASPFRRAYYSHSYTVASSQMSSRQLQSLYKDLKRTFDARPTDLKKCGVLLAQLKVHVGFPCVSPPLISPRSG